MTPPPTTRIEFRRWQPSDLAHATALWTDAEVMRYLGGPYSAAEIEARLALEATNDTAHGIQYWPVFIDGAFAGCCGLKPHQPENRFLEIGFHLLPRFWRGGYGTEAARAVMAYAYESLDAAALFAGHHPENEASRTLLTRLGFVQLGTHYFARTGLQHPWYWRER